MDGFGSATGKVIRAPSLKRGRNDENIGNRIKLERVLGVTVSTNAALDSDANTETVAYPAGCTVVLFNTHTGHQSHIISSSRKTITSLAFSSCGRYLVTGECGHQPAVRIWDLQSDPQPGPPGIAPQVQQVAEFLSHKYGISCVAFSPTSKYVVSVGTQHDMIVNVWDWKNNVKVASNKVSTKVKSLAFAENGSYFVTVGNRLVKFWYLDYGKSKSKEAVPLMGRSAILGEQRNNYFCDVACGKAQCADSTFAITRSGLLCEFNNRRLLDKWVELRTSSANCIAVGETHIFVGCADGIVRCFDPFTLRFVTTLPRTHYLGVDVSQGLNISHMSLTPSEAKYPDTVAVTFDEHSKKITCIYNDHSVYVWDVHNIKRVGKSFTFLYHSACIWGVEISPPQCPLPPGSFLTCSSDNTIRVWTLDKLDSKAARGIYQKNIYSNELLKVVYVDSQLSYLKDLDMSAINSGSDKSDSQYDGRNGVRSIRLSADGKHLASGDREGNIRIHETNGMTEECKIEAHDSEVLCLEYTPSNTGNRLLASASRDRLIHIFDVNKGCKLLQTLEDHSSSITAVRFLNIQGSLQMVSCGADKSLIFRNLNSNGNGPLQFVRGHHATGKTTLYDMEIDSGQKHVLTACQDRNVRVYGAGTAKYNRVFKGSTGDDGSLIKVTLDPSGIYLATSCTDKSLSVYDYYTGECMATMCGHSELATGLRFTNDCRRLISAGGDGCVFVWRVPHDMVITMHARLSQQAMRQGKTLDNELFTDSSSVDFDPNANNVENDYRFSVGALPLWAKKHISDDTSPPPSLNKGVAAPKGRWAQRAERNVGMKSIYTDSIISFPSLHDRRDSDEKDSSLDSGTDTRQYSEVHRESKLISKQSISSQLLSNRRSNLTDDSAIGGSVRDTDIESTAHDGDIDSDQEYRQQPMYYPIQHDSASGSEFTVTNIDADELRRSQRRSKRGNLPTIALQTTSISGSQDSDDDDDEASTPSGENTDRNPMSMLSVSSESLDQIVNREKYLQSTFESLSGAELDTSTIATKSSISSQYLTTRVNGSLSTRNIAVINAAKLTKNDSGAARKREELEKRIAATRQKLQRVGYNSPLKYSQSIHDLSHMPEKDKWNSSNHKQGKSNENLFVLTEKNTSSNRNQIQGTSSLDRHLFTKNMLECEKVTHKPPKGMRRNSSKSRKSKTTYEYIRKEDYFKKVNNVLNNENQVDSIENTVEFNYKEKNLERECENGNQGEETKILHELYDSLDKIELNTKMEYDSLEVNINRLEKDENIFDSLEYNPKRVWKTSKSNCDIDQIQFAIENIKLLNEIQRKVNKINSLVDIFKQNMYSGKVRALSQMYETLTTSQSFYNDLLKSPLPKIKFRRRNLSLPNFVERRLNVVVNIDGKIKNKKDVKEDKLVNISPQSKMDLPTNTIQVHIDAESPDNSLRRACSLSDLSIQSPTTVQSRKIDQVSGKVVKQQPATSRISSRYSKSIPITRSSSTGVLNHSDSDNEMLDKKPQSRLMRPTISSQNKVANNKNIPMRKRQSYSVMNLSSVGHDDSSSEENEKVAVFAKPSVVPRARVTSENGALGRRHQIIKDKGKNNRSTVNFDQKKSSDLDSTLTNLGDEVIDNLDVSTVQLSSQLCDDVAFQLIKAANNVVELYKRITDTTDGSSEHVGNIQKSDMSKTLEISIAHTLKLFQGLTIDKLKQSNHLDIHQTNTVKRLKDLVSSQNFASEKNNVVNTMEAYSDILLNMIQQKIQNSNT